MDGKIGYRGAGLGSQGGPRGGHSGKKSELCCLFGVKYKEGSGRGTWIFSIYIFSR